jgi:hypothetical protein
MTEKKYVYATSDPAAIAAFHAAHGLFQEFGQRVIDDAAKLGNNKGILHRSGFGSLPHFVGLIPDEPTNPPAGWRYLKSRDQLEPIARGKAGEPARQWLTDHQFPPEADVREALAKFGLQRSVQYCDDTGLYFGGPDLLEHDGTLWARYAAEAEKCTWQRRKLSEFHAAAEAAEQAAAEAERAGAR